MKSPGALPSGTWFPSWYVVSIDTGHITQSPQSCPRWSPALKIDRACSISSFTPVPLRRVKKRNKTGRFHSSLISYTNSLVSMTQDHQNHMHCISCMNDILTLDFQIMPYPQKSNTHISHSGRQPSTSASGIFYFSFQFLLII